MTTAPTINTTLDAARGLARAGLWDLGSDLLTAGGADDPRILLALADLSVWRDFWLGTNTADGPLATAAGAIGRSPDPGYAWEVELLTLQHDYFTAIADWDGSTRRDPDAATVADLTDRAERLHTTAPAGAQGGWAAFWRAVIADNIAGESATAKPWYAEALAAAEADRDHELASEALRHLGGQARKAGDHEQARQLWERSTVLRQGLGWVPGVLSQQLALAINAADTGDTSRAAAIAGEVHRWAGVLGLPRLVAGARRFLA